MTPTIFKGSEADSRNSEKPTCEVHLGAGGRRPGRRRRARGPRDRSITGTGKGGFRSRSVSLLPCFSEMKKKMCFSLPSLVDTAGQNMFPPPLWLVCKGMHLDLLVFQHLPLANRLVANNKSIATEKMCFSCFPGLVLSPWDIFFQGTQKANGSFWLEASRGNHPRFGWFPRVFWQGSHVES